MFVVHLDLPEKNINSRKVEPSVCFKNKSSALASWSMNICGMNLEIRKAPPRGGVFSLDRLKSTGVERRKRDDLLNAMGRSWGRCDLSRSSEVRARTVYSARIPAESPRSVRTLIVRGSWTAAGQSRVPTPWRDKESEHSLHRRPLLDSQGSRAPCPSARSPTPFPQKHLSST